MFKLNSASLALFLIERYNSKWNNGHPDIKSKVGTFEYEYDYALLQLHKKTISGIGTKMLDKKVLEIGCGHGGICIYSSMNGAKEVIGIDLSPDAINIANTIKSNFASKGLINPNKVSFMLATTEALPFNDEEFDLIIADNVFEHVSDLSLTIGECKRVLKPGGIIFAPTFPSILSRGGPHLKYGTKIPWLHVFFTEKAICKALYTRALKHPELKLFEYYGGLENKPETFRDVRKYKDLNYITNAKMKKVLTNHGLKIIDFSVNRPRIGIVLMKLIPFLKYTSLDDIFSISSSFKAQKLTGIL